MTNCIELNVHLKQDKTEQPRSVGVDCLLRAQTGLRIWIGSGVYILQNTMVGGGGNCWWGKTIKNEWCEGKN